MKREKSQISEGILSVLTNAGLFVLKFWAGMVTGSIALIADAWHTLSDSLTSVFIIIAAKLASRKSDKEHPFGHGRWEPISSVFIAILLGVVAYEFFTEGLARLQNRESVTYGTIAIVVTVASVAAKELLAQYAFYIARKTGNMVVRADGWHHRTDALSSVVVMAGVIVTQFTDTLWWMDGVLGIFCALAILYAAFQILRESITKLLGEEPSEELIENINSEIHKLYGDLKTHHFHLHNYIAQKEMTMHILLKKDMTIEDGHRIATEIEDMIREKFDIETTIHIEPLEIN